jgi:hypothetical protein
MHYRCFFVTGDDKITDMIEFDSPDDKSALEYAWRLHAAQSAHPGFEIWQEGRWVRSELLAYGKAH